MGESESHRCSLYFPQEMLREVVAEAARLDRSVSWVINRAWKLARQEMKKLPPA